MVPARLLKDARDVPPLHVLQRRQRRAFDRHGILEPRTRAATGRGGLLGKIIFVRHHVETQLLLKETVARITTGAIAHPGDRSTTVATGWRRAALAVGVRSNAPANGPGRAILAAEASALPLRRTERPWAAR